MEKRTVIDRYYYKDGTKYHHVYPCSDPFTVRRDNETDQEFYIRDEQRKMIGRQIWYDAIRDTQPKNVTKGEFDRFKQKDEELHNLIFEQQQLGDIAHLYEPCARQKGGLL